jgi:hypothetical protein
MNYYVDRIKRKTMGRGNWHDLEIRNMFTKFSFGKSEGRPTRRCDNQITINRKEMGFEGAGWILSCEHGNDIFRFQDSIN